MTPLEELIKETQRIKEDAEEARKRARTRRTKRQQKGVEDFFKSINHYLTELKQLKDAGQ